MDVLIKGLAFGFVLALAMGPVFFSLIQTSLEKGFASGVIMAIGISSSDLAYVILTYFGISSFANTPSFKYYVGIIGGLILITFGIYSFFKKIRSEKLARANIRGNNFFRAFLKGFLINGINPFVLIFWLGAMSLATVEYGYSIIQIRTFFFVVLLTVLLTDLTKAYLADKLRMLIRPRLIRIFNFVVGTLLIAFGGRLLYLTLTDQSLHLSL